MKIRAAITTDEKCWVDQDGFFTMIFHFNPKVHGELTLEFLAQIIEKYHYETAGKGYEMYMGSCCRVDYRFDIVDISIEGQKYFREDLKDHYIGFSLKPEETIHLDTFTQINQNVFCCCKKNCYCNTF